MMTDINKRLFQVTAEDFKKIPGSPIAYWIGEKIINLFSLHTIGEKFDVKAGMCTGDNANFIFLWHEIDFSLCKLNTASFLYTPHNKGGEFCKWYGNRECILKYNKDALAAMEKNVGFRHDGKEYYFNTHIGWSKITSGKSSFRIYDDSFTFDSAGLGLFTSNIEDLKIALAFLNSKVTEIIIAFLNPTLNVTPAIIKQLPFEVTIKFKSKILESAEKCIACSKKDWDAFETSWDFVRHPLAFTQHYKEDQLCYGINSNARREAVTLVSARFEYWQRECERRFDELKANEEELNRIFIDIYGLQDELSPEVEEKDVTVRKADSERDIRSLLSYAVGCMFGRYSLDVDGLAYAGGEWDASKYTTFPADADNIIPICDDDYFEDDLRNHGTDRKSWSVFIKTQTPATFFELKNGEDDILRDCV